MLSPVLAFTIEIVLLANAICTKHTSIETSSLFFIPSCSNVTPRLFLSNLQAPWIVFLLCLNRAIVQDPLESEHIFCSL